jgi:hypothetical protein
MKRWVIGLFAAARWWLRRGVLPGRPRAHRLPQRRASIGLDHDLHGHLPAGARRGQRGVSTAAPGVTTLSIRPRHAGLLPASETRDESRPDDHRRGRCRKLSAGKAKPYLKLVWLSTKPVIVPVEGRSRSRSSARRELSPPAGGRPHPPKARTSPASAGPRSTCGSRPRA